jgi:hypothetical protein
MKPYGKMKVALRLDLLGFDLMFGSFNACAPFMLLDWMDGGSWKLALSTQKREGEVMDFDAAGEFTGGIHHWFWKGRTRKDWRKDCVEMKEFNSDDVLCFVGSVIERHRVNECIIQ